MGPRGSERCAQRRDGFTVVELVIALLLAGTVIFAAGSVYVSTERSFKTGSKKLLAQQEASLLSRRISMNVRAGGIFRAYDADDPNTTLDTGNSVEIQNSDGTIVSVYEWNEDLETLVDANGARVTAVALQDVQFSHDAGNNSVLLFEFKTKDDYGNLVDIEGGVSPRN
jgi:Tfp pilus assembly protein PilW